MAFTGFRLLSKTSEDIQIATFDDVRNVKHGTVVIDVREPSELKETGNVPNSVNIPLGQIDEAFNLPDEKFCNRFGIEKPTHETPIILSCKAGIRSEKALLALQKQGYWNLKNYKGGWLDWEEKLKTCK